MLDITALRYSSLQLGGVNGLSPYEADFDFTIFVMTHFFYLFNARAF